MIDKERIHRENLEWALSERERRHQSGVEIVSLIDSIMAVNSRTTEDWQRFEERFVADSDLEEVFPGVKELWESIRNSPEAVLCLSRLTGLARDGLLKKEIERR